jgi:hypothetical protein
MIQQRSREERNAAGFSAIEAILIVVVIAAIGLGGWYVYHRDHKAKPASTVTSTGSTKTITSPPADPYAGWKTATSPRAKFSIKYPTSWTYAEAMGDNDNVEHITLDNANFHITIDSYIGKNPDNGGISTTTCTDCLETLNTTPFSIPKLGNASVDTVRYSIDTGRGNALILRLAGGTYYIPSSDAANVYTAFRGIGNLSSETAYQQETPSQFESNPDYGTAAKIFESVSY